VQEVAGQDYCTERREAKEDNAHDTVDETEEDRANAVGDEANEDDQHSEPSHQAGGGHQDRVRAPLATGSPQFQVRGALKDRLLSLRKGTAPEIRLSLIFCVKQE
jgi:hypothetical protein